MQACRLALGIDRTDVPLNCLWHSPHTNTHEPVDQDAAESISTQYYTVDDEIYETSTRMSITVTPHSPVLLSPSLGCR